jgi:N-methylhydantoinase B
MAKAMSEFHPVLRAGDAFLHNSPYHGNSHAADHTLLVPVVDEDGRHRFTVVAKAHQADCGNALPTTYMAGAEDVYAEGALIFPAVRIQSDYDDCADIIRMCLARIRIPEQWWGDYLAMLGAVRIGERHLLQLASEVGWERLERFASDWFDYSERRMTQAIRGMRGGRRVAHSGHDAFPGVPDGIPVKVEVEVSPEAGTVKVDLRDNVDCVPSGLNLTEATARTAAMVGVFNSIDHTVPKNAGSFRRIEVLLREGSAVGIPVHPTSCSVATTNLADRVTNPVQRALADLGGDGAGMAEAGLSQPPAWGVISGRDPRRGNAAFVNQVIFPSVTGGAASADADGWLTIGHVGNAGMMLRDSVEVDELTHPMLVREQRILPDTEGAGRQRGAPGAYLEYGPVADNDLRVIFVSDGTVNPARGARGGGDGARASQYRRTADGALEAEKPSADVLLRPGEAIVSISCGGGGYGSPLDRSIDAVVDDVVEGWISVQRARDVYGVLVDEDGRPDREGTELRRAELRGSPEPDPTGA